MFPERLEDWIGEDDPVRAIDDFMDEIDLGGLGIDRVAPTASGQVGYSARLTKARLNRIGEPPDIPDFQTKRWHHAKYRTMRARFR